MKQFIALALACVLAPVAFSESKPLQLSLTPEISIHSRDMRIEGLSVNIWGENPQSALALGLVNGSTSNSVGLSVGALNYAENYKGVQFGFVNYVSGAFLGWQGGWWSGLSLINYAENITGIQTGFVNYAGQLTGVQFGAINYADTAINGVQIGFINIMAATDIWFGNFPDEVAPGMIIVNWRFK